MKTNLIKNGRVTEKASMAAESNCYTFDVATTANKTEIGKAIFAQYKVKPVRINVVNIRAKKTYVQGREGSKQSGKKAMVFLKKGDKIEFA
jgi:large subunit ribosomal protein L23